ncbi:heteroglycan glucosidase 1 [Actinidia rufa]|uniref:Heteroglycan glucosidase 1 n=1 Tax=Actinidia rufa TaxID=165716 RepID=A0A7J0H0L2_9ERIC|nr:heteroglycan glucosidase 1 [Actinidia rufa]
MVVLSCDVEFGSIPDIRIFHCVSQNCWGYRTKRNNKRLVGGRLIVSKMSEFEDAAATSDVKSGNMVFEPILEQGVFRFDCSVDDRNAALPSISFVNSKERDTPIMGNHTLPLYTPTFECVHGQQIVRIELPIGTTFYGTGEVSGQLERTGKRVFTWNTDAWGYGLGTTSLYQSHPWVLAVLPSGEALGVLADTTTRCEIDLRKESTIKFIALSSYPVITFGPFTSPTDERFPDPRSLVEDLHLNGFKAIWMLDPGIKQEEGYFVYDSGSEKDIWIQTANGKPFVGEVWPGPCVFPDFTQSKARSWWASLVKDFISNGVDGIWNDMNEPAVFKVVTKTMPESNVHRGDIELGGCQNHSYYHNVYGMLMARSTYEGMKSANENKRPFVLTRAGFIGSQRYAATWTGDNLSTWEHLRMSISMVLQLGRLFRDPPIPFSFEDLDYKLFVFYYLK